MFIVIYCGTFVYQYIYIKYPKICIYLFFIIEIYLQKYLEHSTSLLKHYYTKHESRYVHTSLTWVW